MMKKILIGLLLFAIFILSSCGLFQTELVEHEGYIELYINESYLEYMPYDEVPSYKFVLPEGVKINTTKYRSDVNEIIFSGNDDFVVSDIFEQLFTTYQAKNRFSTRSVNVTNIDQTHLNRNVITESGEIKSERVYLKVPERKMYNEIALITLENGLQLTTSHARFVGEVEGQTKTYYSWSYSESIRTILYFPLMVVKNSDGTKNILLVALPNGVINQVETRLDAKGIYDNEDFLNESYYTYEYADLNRLENTISYDNTEEVARMKEYYTENFQGRMIGEKFVYTYLGINFSIEFGERKFIIRYEENI